MLHCMDGGDGRDNGENGDDIDGSGFDTVQMSLDEVKTWSEEDKRGPQT